MFVEKDGVYGSAMVQAAITWHGRVIYGVGGHLWCGWRGRVFEVWVVSLWCGRPFMAWAGLRRGSPGGGGGSWPALGETMVDSR